MGEPKQAASRRALPWWITLAVGALVAAAGVMLVTRPFASVESLLAVVSAGLALLAVVEFVRWVRLGARSGWWRAVLGCLLVAAFVVSLIRPALTVGLVVVLLAVTLIGLGAADVVRALLGRADGRLVPLLSGLTGVVFGVVALSWPDVTIMIVGVLFGVWLVITGARLVLAGVRARPGARPRPASSRRAGWRTAGAIVGFVAAIATAFVAVRLTGTPVPDAFYAAPDGVPDEPGVLLRSEPFSRTIPDGATGWRILYTTTRDDGVPAIASGLVVVPDDGDEHPVIAWAHGTTGVGVGCAPSLLAEPFVAGAMPDLTAALERGWAVVATDYVGLGADAPHPYVVGQPEGRSVLDAVRAAAQLDGVALGGQTVVWGHSQGGQSALWAGGLASEYAPELDIVGVAAMAPAANLPVLVSSFADSALGALFGSFVMVGYAGFYDDIRIEDYVRPEARVIVEEIGNRCLTDASTIVSVAETAFADRPVWSTDPAAGPMAERAEQNVPRLPIAAPLLLAQGLADPLVLPDAQRAYVESLCESGQQVDFRTYEGLDHMGIVTGDSPLLGELLDWTEERFSGAAPKDTC